MKADHPWPIARLLLALVIAALLTVGLLAPVGATTITRQSAGGPASAHPVTARAASTITSSLTPNPSFEEVSLAGWSSWQGALSRVTLASAPEGTAVARIAQATGNAYSLEWYPSASLGIGGTVTASAYVAAASSSSVGKPVSLTVREKNGSTIVAATSSPTVNLTTAFQHITVTATIRAATDHLDLYVLQSSAVAGDAFYADGVRLTAGEAAPPPSEETSLSNTPCTVTINATQQTGTCNGTFRPTPATPPPPQEEPTGGATVSSTPTGPATPAGGWHVAFADGFGAKLAASEGGPDNFWWPNENSSEPFKSVHGNNTNELEAYNASQAHVTPEGLQLVDEYHPNALPAGSEGGRSFPVRNYLSGAAQTTPSASAIHPFTWKPGGGETWAFECVCKLPPYFRGVDTGWWTTDGPWTDEVDFFESWTSGSDNASEGLLGFAWVYETGGSPKTSETWTQLWRKFDPSAAFHHYTTVIQPNNAVEEFIDGVKTVTYGPPPFLKATPAEFLILSNALRAESSGATFDKQFLSGTRVWTIRSISVYEDGNHAGMGVAGGGIAPGTTVK